MRHTVELVAQRPVELRDAMAECRDPQRRDGVEVAAPVDVDQLASLGRLDDDRLVVDVRRHLGEAMPDHGRVPRAPGCCIPHQLAACQRAEGRGESVWRSAGRSRAAGTLVGLLDKGLIGFDVEIGSRIVRPELLRLLKRGTNTTANEQYALAA
jgi:hypothetical protein